MEKTPLVPLAGALVLLLAVVVLIWFANKSANGPVGETPRMSNRVSSPLAQFQPQTSTPVASSSQAPAPTMQIGQIDPKKSYSAVLNTSEGAVIVDLYAHQTPITVNNFVSLARKNFYDKTTFHRVVKGFMIQGGDPKGDGTGGPGYRFDDEPFSGDYLRGTLAMANAGPDTNGSQFFIIQADNLSLPKNYVIFGKVVKGIEVVDKIANADVGPNDFGENSKPISPVFIKSLEIREK